MDSETVKVLSSSKDFYREISLEICDGNSGLKSSVDTSSIYNRYTGLFSDYCLTLVTSRMILGSGVDRQRLQNLLYFLTSNYCSIPAASDDDALFAYEVSTSAEIEGKKVDYLAHSMLIENEPDSNKRRNIFFAFSDIRKEINSRQKLIISKRKSRLNSLGYRSEMEMCSVLKLVDYNFLKELGINYLVSTNNAYLASLKKHADEHSISLENIDKNDLAYMLHVKKFDQFFGSSVMLDRISKFFLGIGLDLSKGIQLDTEDRPGKSPRAFCSPIDPPFDVRLIMRPSGGISDYDTFLHESGHALHFANSSPSLPFELLALSLGNSLSETYAFLFQHLVFEKPWLNKVMDVKDADEICSFGKFFRLYMTRRYFGKLLYEIKFHNNDLSKLDGSFKKAAGEYADFSECYADILTKATSVKYYPDSYLIDMDQDMYVADYLRAWIAEAMLTQKLRSDYGPEWYFSPDAGVFIKSLFALGCSISVEDLASRLGYKGLDISPLVNQLTLI